MAQEADHSMPCMTISSRRNYFPLFELPAEIRLKIYEYALLDHERTDAQTREGIVNMTKAYRTPSLLATCQEMRKEGTSIYYPNTTFRFVHSREIMLPWVRSLPIEARAQIRNVCVPRFFGPRQYSKYQMLRRYERQLRAEGVSELVEVRYGY